MQPVLRHIPIAIYVFGLYHYGAEYPFKTIQIRADSRAEAESKAYKELISNTVQSIKHIDTLYKTY